MRNLFVFSMLTALTWVHPLVAGLPLYEVGNRHQNWNLGQNVSDSFLDKIQPIFTKRCVSCHGCYEAPCQLNLQSYDGIRRGYHPLALYSGKRLEYTSPKRLVDASSIREWREKGFLPVTPNETEIDSETQPDRYRDSLMYQFLAQASQNNGENFPVTSLANIQNEYLKTEKHQCVATSSQMKRHFSSENPWQVISFDDFISKNRYAGMPFGLPKLQKEEESAIYEWLEAGTPGPSQNAEKLLAQSANPKAIQKWEAFLNGDSAKEQQTARYIYEHVFSALLHIDESPGEYYELVRSRTRAGDISQIVTEVPYDAPGVSRVFYRMKKVTRAIVQKTQNIWRLNETKREHLIAQFLSADWGSDAIPFPSYASNNMFQYFSAIPARIRSRFVMENSRLIVGAMVQGTVCIGSRATYAIADHFWAWFLKPESDPSVINPTLGMDSVSFLGTAPQPWEPQTLAGRKLLALAERMDLTDLRIAKRLATSFRKLFSFVRMSAGSDESDSMVAEFVVHLKDQGLKTREILGAVLHFLRSTDANQEYQTAFERQLRVVLKPRANKGLTFNDLWTGNGDPTYPQANNPNAWLNITRHEKSATVQFGPEGGMPQSIWIMSYSNFERLYYNLVVHFKVWGSITHKLATWRHMSYVRLEGEDLAISMLPLNQREEVRGWFTRGLGGIKNKLFFPLHSVDGMYSGPSLIPNIFRPYDLPARPAGESTIVGRTAMESVTKLVSQMRTRLSTVVQVARVNVNLASPAQTVWEETVRTLQNRSEATTGDRFAQHLPNISYIRVAGPEGQTWVYSLLVNRGYKAHNIVFLESPNKDPQFDTVSIYRGLVGAYPGIFLDVSEVDRAGFVSDVSAMKTLQDWERLRSRFAVARNRSGFWQFFDWLHEWKALPAPGNDPVEQGIVDLSQYEIF